MKFIVESAVRDNYPGLRIGFLVARNIDNARHAEGMAAEKTRIEEEVRERLGSPDALPQHPMVKLWRDVYRDMGAKPAKYRPTVEALLRRIVNGNAVPLINPAVNAYILAELTTLLPMGGYDLARLEGNLTLRYSGGGEPFRGFGGPEECTDPGEIVYADQASVLTRKWNYRDCLRTQITAASTDIILMTEAPLAAVEDDVLLRTVHLAAAAISRYCGGQITTGVCHVRESLSFPMP